MENQLGAEEMRMQGLLDRYLRVRASNESSDASSDHPDEDTFSAFVEGRIGDAEYAPVVSHLTRCSHCRHVTAELIRLDAALADAELPAAATPVSEPTSIGTVLSGILTRMFGTSDGAVFAHEERKDEEPEESVQDEKIPESPEK
jgi:hypothetical protein